MKQSVTCFGSSTRDVFVRLSPGYFGGSLCFEQGSKVPISDIGFFSGGGATNTATGFSRLGFKASVVSAVGKDEDGRQVKKELQAERVGTANLVEEKKRTPYSVIITGVGKDRVILHYSGSSALLGHSHEINWRKISPDWMYVSGLHQNDTRLLGKIFSHAKKTGAKIAWNPGQKEISTGMDKLAQFMDCTDVLIMNASEALSLTGKTSVEKNLALLCLHAGIVAITDGRNGAHACAGGKIFSAKPFNVKVVDVTGAGDAFGCGFVSAVAKGKNLAQALDAGCANASSVVMFLGTKNRLLSEREIHSFIRAHRRLR
ncbi:MAG: carbohydrate kinase family protein [Candidatus Diapherotrites archaeon]|nr:carbohydrate kinase family protein [Candidatus Diapherotrites archaeon]